MSKTEVPPAFLHLLDNPPHTLLSNPISRAKPVLRAYKRTKYIRPAFRPSYPIFSRHVRLQDCKLFPAPTCRFFPLLVTRKEEKETEPRCIYCARNGSGECAARLDFNIGIPQSADADDGYTNEPYGKAFAERWMAREIVALLNASRLGFLSAPSNSFSERLTFSSSPSNAYCDC